MSSTPIIDFGNRYGVSGTVRAHMPGHKGRGSLGCEEYDITEISGADELYGAKGIIRESEENAARLFGAGRTLYSCEGSSLAIRAMLYLALLSAKEAGQEGRYCVLAGRNAHKTLMTAAALLDLDVDWLPAQASLLSSKTDIRALDSMLADAEKKPIAVYVTSPDYLGSEENIRDIAAVCHWHGVPLLVDNAHGAYLKFLENSRHPIDLGADMCCDSAHKTLPCLTGAAYLHINRSASPVFFENAETALALFASTSPSYLILRSLDGENAYIENGFGERLSAFIKKVNEVKERLTRAGFELMGTEELKISLLPKRFGYTGAALADYLRENGIECEFSDEDHTVLMLSCENTDEELLKIEKTLLSLEKRPPILTKPPAAHIPERAMSIREAVLRPQLLVPLENAAGRVMGNDHCACPPAVPVVTAGELIDEESIEAMRYYGISECRVVK